MISSRVVVFPQPDSPTIEKHSPSRMSKLSPSTAFTVPIRRLSRAPFMSGKCFLTSREFQDSLALVPRQAVKAGDRHGRGGEDGVDVDVRRGPRS